MAEPCRQEVTIAEMKADNRHQDDVLVSMQRTLEENTRLLRVLSEIGADVRHIREDQLRQERDIDAIYKRVRVLELAPGQMMSKAAMIMLTAGCGSLGGVVTGVVMWMIKGAA